MSKKAFNPVEYKQDFMNLATTAPHEAADVAMKWRERFVNQVQTSTKGKEEMINIGGAGLGAGVMSVLDGGWEAKRDAMIRDWEAEGHIEAETDLETHPTPFSHEEGGSDPTKIFNLVDKVLVGTLFLGLVAGFKLLGNKVTPYVRAAAVGSGVYWVGSVGRNWGYKMAENRLNAAAESESAAA